MTQIFPSPVWEGRQEDALDFRFSFIFNLLLIKVFNKRRLIFFLIMCYRKENILLLLHSD
jgi:hypothetical protein